jgi:hypothetical protein
MPRDNSIPAGGSTAIGRSNTGIPPPTCQETNWATARQSKWPEVFHQDLNRSGIRQQPPQEGNHYA